MMTVMNQSFVSLQVSARVVFFYVSLMVLSPLVLSLRLGTFFPNFLYPGVYDLYFNIEYNYLVVEY